MQVDPVYIPPEWDTKQKCLMALHSMLYKLGAGREKEESFAKHYNAAYYMRMHLAKEGKTGSVSALDSVRRGLRRLFLHYARGYATKAHIYETGRLQTRKRQREIVDIVNSTIGSVFNMYMQDTVVFGTHDGSGIVLGCDEARLFDQNPGSVPEVTRFVVDFVKGRVGDVDPTSRWGLKLHTSKQWFDFMEGRKTRDEVSKAIEELVVDNADFRAALENVVPRVKPSDAMRAKTDSLMKTRGLNCQPTPRLEWNLDRWRELGKLIGHVAVVRRRCLLAWNEHMLRPENLENVASYTEARARFATMSA